MHFILHKEWEQIKVQESNHRMTSFLSLSPIVTLSMEAITSMRDFLSTYFSLSCCPCSVPFSLVLIFSSTHCHIICTGLQLFSLASFGWFFTPLHLTLTHITWHSIILFFCKFLCYLSLIWLYAWFVWSIIVGLNLSQNNGFLSQQDYGQTMVCWSCVQQLGIPLSMLVIFQIWVHNYY